MGYFPGKKLNLGENNVRIRWYQWQKEMNGSERFPIGLIIGKPHCTCPGQNFYASTCDLASQLVILMLKIVLRSSFRWLKLKSNSKWHKKNAFHNCKYIIPVQNWSTKLISWQDIFTDLYSISGVLETTSGISLLVCGRVQENLSCLFNTRSILFNQFPFHTKSV